MNAPTTAQHTTGVDLEAARKSVDEVLRCFLQGKATRTAIPGGLPAEVTNLLAGLLGAGGKRLRPLLCVLGWHAVAGNLAPVPARVIRIAAALEMFHAFALIHDDVMDDSATRRGQPTIHHQLASMYPGPERAGVTPMEHSDPRTGENCAILIGDVALCWSDEIFHSAELTSTQLTRVLPLMDNMRTELMYGQYLDLTLAHQPPSSTAISDALKTIRYKTAKYTIERPLHIGAILAGGDDAFLSNLSSFALPLGEAFQLRDDLLGVFGDPARTGKPDLDDMREGKHTVLICLAFQAATPAGKVILNSLYGNPLLKSEGAEEVRTVIRGTGADRRLEEMIHYRYDRALRALDSLPVTDSVRGRMEDLAKRCVWRTV